MKELITPKVTDIVERLERPDALVLTRYGDGELWCMHNRYDGNCDGVRFSPALGRSLWASWWYFAWQSMYRANVMVHIHRSMLRNSSGRDIENVDFWQYQDFPLYDCFWVEDSVLNGEFCRLLKALSQQKCLLVGPPHFSGPYWPDHWHYLDVHNERAFDELMTVLSMVVASRGWGVKTVILCCGLASEVMAMQIDIVTEGALNIIDVGSALDPIAGRRSRGYQSRSVTDEIVDDMKQALGVGH